MRGGAQLRSVAATGWTSWRYHLIVLRKTLFMCMAVYIITPVRGAAVGKKKADRRSGPLSSQLPNFLVEISKTCATSRHEAWRMSAHWLSVKK